MTHSRRQARIRRVISFTHRKPGSGLENEASGDGPLPHIDDLRQTAFDVLAKMQAVAPDEVGDPAEFRRALELVFRHAETGLATLAASPQAAISGNELAALEAVVEADGSRPSLLLKNASVNLAHPLVGQWQGELKDTQEMVAEVAPSIGRVEPSNGSGNNFFGTATVVDAGKGLVLTNWHVLEVMCRKASTLFEQVGADRFRFYDGVFIDFAAESGSLKSNRFKIVEAQCPSVDGQDFARLDAAVLKIAPMESEQEMPKSVRVTSDADGALGGLASLCIIGHPGTPPAGMGVETIGDKTIDWGWVNATLFGNRFGFKRLAPGEVDIKVGDTPGDPKNWVFAHDATSLGGSSGSPVIGWLDGGDAFGLHFAGETLRANYAHAIAACADQLRALGVPIS